MRFLPLALSVAFISPAVSQERQEQQRVVRGLNFEGNRAIPDQTLAAGISTTVSGWFARSWLVRWLGLGEKRYFDEQEFRRDVVRLEVLYKRSGYPDVQVDTTVRRTPENAYVTFRIEEGSPIKVTRLEVNGLDSLPAWLRRIATLDLPLRPGDPFNRYLMQASSDSVTSRLQNRGYPNARVFTAFETNKEARTASVTLDAVPGKRAVIGAVDVVGADRVDPGLVRSLLAARPGRRFSHDDLLQSQRNLYNSDLFRFASVRIDSAEYQAGQDSVPLLVQVNESRPRRIRVGMGYATEDCFRGSLGWTTRNFLGGGRILDLSARTSKVGVASPTDWGLQRDICSALQEDTIASAKLNYSLSGGVRRPAFLSPNNAISASLYTERRSEFKVYLRQETGATVTFSRQSPQRRFPLNLALAYTLSYGRTEATAANFCAFFNACTPEVLGPLRQDRVLATLTGTAALPRINNPVEPSRGSQKTFTATFASKYIGSSSFEQFTRFVAEAAWYRSLSRDVVLSWRVRGGLIFAPQVGVGTDTASFIPPEHRFYAGGPNDVRGYERNELGPVVYVVSKAAVDQAAASPDGRIEPDSVSVAASGGNTLAVANVELRVPSPVLRSRLRLAAFVDAGALWQRRQPNSPAVLRVTPGFGIRVGTPLGPARLDLAYNPYRLQRGPLFQVNPDGSLTPVPGQESYELDRRRNFTLHFAVGQAF